MYRIGGAEASAKYTNLNPSIALNLGLKNRSCLTDKSYP